jgi:hypothetical protein
MKNFKQQRKFPLSIRKAKEIMREREQDKTNKIHRTEKGEKMCILNVVESTLRKG